MIGSLLLFAVLPVQAAPLHDDVVVIGERMRRLRVITRTDRATGTQRCIVRRTSGDPALDAAMCTAVLACAATAKRPPDMEACMKPRMDAIVAEQRRPR